MKLGELIFVAVLSGIPAWLVLRAWRRYFALNLTSVGDLLQMRIGLTLLSITASMWLALLVLMILEEYSNEARSVAQKVSPSITGLINFLLCSGGLACSWFRRKSAHESLPVRRAVALASGCLMLIWLLLMSNPH